MPPRWACKERAKPGEPGFSSIPGEQEDAQRYQGKRRPMSGAGLHPFDWASSTWLGDSKEVAGSGHRVKRDFLFALARRATQEGRRPLYRLAFWNGSQQEAWVLIREHDLMELIDAHQ